MVGDGRITGGSSTMPLALALAMLGNSNGGIGENGGLTGQQEISLALTVGGIRRIDNHNALATRSPPSTRKIEKRVTLQNQVSEESTRVRIEDAGSDPYLMRQ